jgi:hypothetical protein
MSYNFRRPRIGTYEFADYADSKNQNTLVRIRKSTVCDGVGVFATRDVPEGTPMTGYACVIVTDTIADRTRQRKHGKDYAYEFSDGVVIDGHPKVMAYAKMYTNRCMYESGCGNLVNDAVHEDVTSTTNNCEFTEKHVNNNNNVYIVTSRAVKKGEELLVSYSLDYWLSRASMWTGPLKEFADVHVAKKKYIEAATGTSCWMEEYIGCGEYIVSLGNVPNNCTCESTNNARRVAVRDDGVVCNGCRKYLSSK